MAVSVIQFACSQQYTVQHCTVPPDIVILRDPLFHLCGKMWVRLIDKNTLPVSFMFELVDIFHIITLVLLHTYLCMCMVTAQMYVIIIIITIFVYNVASTGDMWTFFSIFTDNWI